MLFQNIQNRELDRKNDVADLDFFQKETREFPVRMRRNLSEEAKKENEVFIDRASTLEFGSHKDRC